MKNEKQLILKYSNLDWTQLINFCPQIEVKMTIKDSIGGWKDNFFQYKSPKVFTTLKKFLEKAWMPIMTGLGYFNKYPIHKVQTLCIRISVIIFFIRITLYKYTNTYLLRKNSWFQGTYIATGVNTTLIMDSNLPKTFFYGTYKYNVIISKDNIYYGCFIVIVELKRPWENYWSETFTITLFKYSFTWIYFSKCFNTVILI